MRPLFVLALLAIIHFSLFPWRFTNGFSRPIPWLGIGSVSDITDIAINLAFYLAPALIGQWALTPPHTPTKTKLRTLALLTCGFALLSFTLETLQLAIPGRYANLRDIACNTFGALLGAALAILIPLPQQKKSWSLPPQVSSLAIFLIAWTIFQAFPFIPYIRLHRVLHYADPLRNPTWPFTEMADVFFGLLIIYLASQHLRLPALPIAAAAALLLPAQGFLRDLTLSPARLAAAALALLAAATLFRRPRQMHYSALAVLLTFWLLARQLSPGSFATEVLTPFSWLPFGTLVEVQRGPSLRLLADKFLLYAAAIWLWHRAGIDPRAAAGSVVFLIAITEAMQCYLPGRTPETTDILLALLAAWLLLGRQLTSGIQPAAQKLPQSLHHPTRR